MPFAPILARLAKADVGVATNLLVVVEGTAPRTHSVATTMPLTQPHFTTP